MVRHYQRKSQRQSWGEQSMSEALSAVRDGTSLRHASKVFNVPLATLQRRHKDKNKCAKGSRKALGNFKTTFHADIEADLINYIFKMESIMFGLTTADVRSLAFQIAERNNIPNSFNRNTKMAGRDWLYHFRKRHQEIALRQPEATSAARAMAFNQQNVNNFFDLLEPLVDTHFFHPNNIYNVDETGMTTVQTKSSRILAKRGRRQVGSLVSAERGELVTVEICMSATGSFIPPMFIFPRVRMKPELMNGAPPGSISTCHKSGWMQTSIFTEWFIFFIRMSGATKENPVLLILDGHSTHTKNIEVIDLARENGVELLCLPPHCSHKMQPLDVSFMKPLSTFYDQEVEKWLRNNPGRVVTIYQVAELFGRSFTRAATLETAINGFRKTGIFPTNRDVFKPEDFAASETTDFPAPEFPSTPATCTSVGLEGSVIDSTNPFTPVTLSTVNLDRPSTSMLTAVATPITVQNSDSASIPPSSASTATSSLSDPVQSTSSSEASASDTVSAATHRPLPSPPTSREGFISPFRFSPPPKASVRPNRSNRRGKATVLTSSPYKESLLATSKASKGKQHKGKRPSKTQGVYLGPKKGKQVPTIPVDESDAECIYCAEWWSASTLDDMIRCTTCHEWAHTACAGIDKHDVQFVCDMCI